MSNVIRAHNVSLYAGDGRREITLTPLTDAELPLLERWNRDPEVLYWSEGDVVAA